MEGGGGGQRADQRLQHGGGKSQEPSGGSICSVALKLYSAELEQSGGDLTAGGGGS